MGERTPNRDSILMACGVPFYENLYVLGTLARRVSFATQQRRAFNLPKAIDDNLKRSGCPTGLKGKNIAIVGASLSGSTSALAFSVFEANVYVYDGQKSSMAHIEKAKHRPIHPSINFWPRESVSPTTDFPALNWFQDSCDNVKRRIDEGHKKALENINLYLSLIHI